MKNIYRHNESSGFGRLFRWGVGFAVLVMAAMSVTAGWEVLKGREGRTTFGWNEGKRNRTLYVATTDRDGPANGFLQPGDLVLSLNGDPYVARAGTEFYRSALPSGDFYQLIVSRNGQSHEYNLKVGVIPRPPGALASTFFVGLVWCSVALFIGIARPDQAAARLAFAGAAIVGTWFLSTVAGSSIITSLLFPLHVVVGYHFFYRFPEGVPSGRAWTVLLAFLYSGAAVAITLGQLSNWVYLSGGPAAATRWAAEHPALFIPQLPLRLGVYFVAVAAIVGVTARNYSLVTGPDQRRRIRWIAYSGTMGLVAVACYAGLQLLPLVVGVEGVPWSEAGFSYLRRVANLLTVSIPLSVAYAVVKYRVLDVKLVLRRGLQYLLARRALQVLLGLPAVGLAYTIVTNRNETITEVVVGNREYIYWIAAISLSLKFRRYLSEWLDHKFFREQYDRDHVLMRLVEDLDNVESISSASELAGAQLDLALHPKAIYLWFFGDSVFKFAYPSSYRTRAIIPPLGGRLVEYLEKSDEPLEVLQYSKAEFPRDDLFWLEDLMVQLLLPIRSTNGPLLGVLMLGEKKSEEPYSGSDSRLLQAVARQIAIVHANLQLKADVAEERRIRRQVLAHLDESVLNLLKECPLCGACFDSSQENCSRDGQVLSLPLPIERTIDGKYRIDQFIGKGG